jgi:hypothetical protein
LRSFAPSVGAQKPNKNRQNPRIVGKKSRTKSRTSLICSWRVLTRGIVAAIVAVLVVIDIRRRRDHDRARALAHRGVGMTTPRKLPRRGTARERARREIEHRLSRTRGTRLRHVRRAVVAEENSRKRPRRLGGATGKSSYLWSFQRPCNMI